ncbi:16S rRNA (cytosine1402-N4)-methyltransferase [Microcella putealis]|uniref:Ribosomal RNA small subunit methyltransferase H n=2 Tax=Microcella putealis TaxID=337005 RepID=A0A4Q7LL65_9MICO|nr:16S rRNA (cytosine1402-N4)-methyltransferase [Microcella putealis]TQM24908.1 16S rRNA (cytosine1402-N4)-methyltransferase [Microcella putealis]
MGIRAPRPADTPMTDQKHTPVMLDRCLELLEPAIAAPGAVLIDATLGLGGHTEAALTRFPELTVVGLDRDTDALALATARLAPFGDRFRPVHTVYDRIRDALDGLGIDRVNGVLFDLGVSSMQLDEAERGFAYAQDAPLDMRMDRTSGQTAAEVLASYPESALRRIFERYGEERLAPRYARRIVEARMLAPIERSDQLNRIIADATPQAARRPGHPAKRVYQALRIEVNAELAALEDALPAALDALIVGGRIVVLAYQSLEDRIVKREFAARSRSTAPAGLPVELPEHAPELRLLVRGAEQADDAERALNPRAIPVRLRAAQRLREVA